MKKLSWVVGSQAVCQDCGWKSPNWKNAQATGAIHAKSHDHFVTVETVLVSYYNYPEGALDR